METSVKILRDISVFQSLMVLVLYNLKFYFKTYGDFFFGIRSFRALLEIDQASVSPK